MTTDVRYGRKRRGRRAGRKSRTPRAAIAAGTLAAASIPLWPSAAGAGDLYVPDEYKSGSHTFQPIGDNVSCPVVVTSRRDGERVSASTIINSSETFCRELIVQIQVQYIPVGSDSVKSITANGTGGLVVSADGARDLTQSKHMVGWNILWFGCDCVDYTLTHSK
jgi:hypothetical protein